MKYAVLEVPDFPLHARTRLERPDPRPIAIYEGEGRRATLAHLNSEALNRGLNVSMSAVQALGLCPDLRIHPRSEPAEREAMALLMAAAWSLSPRVEATSPGLCTVDLSGRDAHALRRDLEAVRGRMNAAQLPLRVGVAHSPGVARFAAFHASPERWVDESSAFLRPLPVILLELTQHEAELFEGLGLRTLGDLARLPLQSITQRLGARGAELCALASGQDSRPLKSAMPPAQHVATYDLEHPAETVEPLLFLLRRFIDRLAGQIQDAGLVVGELRLELRLEDESKHERTFRLPQPNADADALFSVLDQHLTALRTDSSVAGLSLEAIPAIPACRQESIFESSLRDPGQFFTTLARVAAVLGADRVGTPAIVRTRRPDAIALAPPTAVIPEHRPAPRPPVFGPVLRRYRPPLPATVELGEGGPAYVHCALASTHGVIVQTRGPWRCSGHWWDGQDVWAREEWDIQVAPAGLYLLAHTNTGWWIEGVYS